MSTHAIPFGSSPIQVTPGPGGRLVVLVTHGASGVTAEPATVEISAYPEGSKSARFLGRVELRQGRQCGTYAVAEASFPGAWKWLVRLYSRSPNGGQVALEGIASGEPCSWIGVRPIGRQRAAFGHAAAASWALSLAYGERLRLVSGIGDTGGGTISSSVTGQLGTLTVPEDKSASAELELEGPAIITFAGLTASTYEIERMP